MNHVQQNDQGQYEEEHLNENNPEHSNSQENERRDIHQEEYESSPYDSTGRHQQHHDQEEAQVPEEIQDQEDEQKHP